VINRMLGRLATDWRALRAAAGGRLSESRRRSLESQLRDRGIRKLNLCCGVQRVPGYFGIDLVGGADLRLDLETTDLPFRAASLDTVVCMSAINYFTRERARRLAQEMCRVLRPGGVCRVGVQDMKALAERYVRGDREFFFQKLPDGRERFEGPTLGDKFAAWFYGYAVDGHPCRYFYDFDSLAHLFRAAGFALVERKAFGESRLPEAREIDNRPDQMFYLEAVK
jgi:SAM-dependent methyltransferase